MEVIKTYQNTFGNIVQSPYRYTVSQNNFDLQIREKSLDKSI